MRAKNMSENTIGNYCPMLEKFFAWAQEDSLRISYKRIQDYILSIPEHYSNSFRNQTINAIKLYFLVIENKEIKDIYVPRPKHDEFIPNVLNEQQIKKVIFGTVNLKHRAILFTIYDGALRISEAIDLELSDVRSKDKNPHIIIRHAKHHSSRILYVSERCINLLREYYKQYKPEKYLFEGTKGVQYSRTSIRKILDGALAREGININIRTHDLRHSFATNSLAKGTNLYHLSQYLGHKSTKTTERTYSHLQPNQIKINRAYA